MEKLNPSSFGCEKDCLPIVKKIILVVRWVASLRWNMKLILKLSRVVVWGTTRWTMSKTNKLKRFRETTDDVCGIFYRTPFWSTAPGHPSCTRFGIGFEKLFPSEANSAFSCIFSRLLFQPFATKLNSSFFHFLSLGSRTLTPKGESISISVWYLNNKKSSMFRNANQYWISVFFAFQVRDIEDIA